MPSHLTVNTVTPTVQLRHGPRGLEQRIRVEIENPGSEAAAATIRLSGGVAASESRLRCNPGATWHDIFVDEPDAAGKVAIELTVGDEVHDRVEPTWAPPRHWTVHVVHSSHHDVGYTDLPSHVLPEHDQWLDQAIDMAAATADFPDPAQFRIVVEQNWSIRHFLERAPAARAEAMIKLIQSGHVEVTALFGNMTTELCGHEALVRTLYHADRLARRTGVPIVSAEHNDIPGFAWGLAEVLADAGVRFFCPGIPLYYDWGGSNLPSFWDEQAVFGSKGIPGAFWWESPSGRRVLFWCNNHGCGGGRHVSLPGLAERLLSFEQQGYPYDVVRWPVIGGARDNAPYLDGFARTIKAWNEDWAWPKLVSSTNARFYADFSPRLPDDLPTWRGDIPGQDYPVGAASTAAATAVNRRNHAALPAAETLASLASQLTPQVYPGARLDHAYEETLWHDEHTWGHHFPAGPTFEAHALEKAVHAYRAAALAHDVANKSMAVIADAVRLDEPGIHLVVFNSAPRSRTDLVSAPLRELDNCGSEMFAVPPEEDAAGGYLKPALLGNRWHVSPARDFIDGKFDLIDAATGDPVQYQIAELDSPMAPVPYAAQRIGLGAGSRRYGFFEDPVGLTRDLQFVAADVPAGGYRTYRLAPRAEAQEPAPAAVTARGTTIESEFHRVTVDGDSGAVTSLYDKRTGHEFVDPGADEPFGGIVVRDPDGTELHSRCTQAPVAAVTPLHATLHWTLAAPGLPVVEVTMRVAAASPRIEFAVHVLKDPRPLAEVFLAFPFAVPKGRFRLDEPLAAAATDENRLPGAFCNRLTAQNWVSADNGEAAVLWSALDAPVISVGRRHPARVSPAHSAVPPVAIDRPPPPAEDFTGGHVYSLLFANNFGTNFSVTQDGTALFRYVMTTAEGGIDLATAGIFGEDATTPLATILTKHPGNRVLPPAGELLRIDDSRIRLLTLKGAEDGDGLIARLWNPGDSAVDTRLRLPTVEIGRAALCTVLEVDQPTAVEHGAHDVAVSIAARGVATVRITPMA